MNWQHCFFFRFALAAIPPDAVDGVARLPILLFKCFEQEIIWKTNVKPVPNVVLHKLQDPHYIFLFTH